MSLPKLEKQGRAIALGIGALKSPDHREFVHVLRDCVIRRDVSALDQAERFIRWAGENGLPMFQARVQRIQQAREKIAELKKLDLAPEVAHAA